MLEYMKWGESMEKNIQSKPQPKKGLKKRRIKEILFIDVYKRQHLQLMFMHQMLKMLMH